MNRNPLVSIVIPIYKVEKYLKACLDSVLKQTYTNYEVLLINDGSPEDERTICLDYISKDLRFRYYEKENGGLADARNYGIEKMKGEFVTFIDSDDYVEPMYLENLIEHFQKKTQCDISMCSIKMFYQDKEQYLNVYYEDREIDGVSATKDLCYSNGIECYAWGKMYRSSLFEQIRFTKGRLFEDIDIMWKLFLASKKVVVSSKCDYVYRQRHGSILNSVFNENKLVLLDIMKEFEDTVSNEYPTLKGAVLRRKLFSEIWLLVQCVSDKNDFHIIENDLKSKICKDSRKVFFDSCTSYKDRIKLLIINIGGIEVYIKLQQYYLKRGKFEIKK